MDSRTRLFEQRTYKWRSLAFLLFSKAFLLIDFQVSKKPLLNSNVGRRTKSMTRDYPKHIEEFWPTIMLAWNEHGEKHPIVECDVMRRKVATMPAKEYIDGLTERTRDATHDQFKSITAEGGMMVFVRDSKNRVLQSHVFVPQDETE